MTRDEHFSGNYIWEYNRLTFSNITQSMLFFRVDTKTVPKTRRYRQYRLYLMRRRLMLIDQDFLSAKIS